jgi:hypothetical protein
MRWVVMTAVFGCEGAMAGGGDPLPNSHVRRVIESVFQGWRVFVSDRGRWWAMRGPLSCEQLRAGCAGSVDADNPAQLCLRLAEQAVRDERRLGR